MVKIKLSKRGRGAAVYVYDCDSDDLAAWAVRAAARGEPPWWVEIAGAGYKKIVVVPR
jgi:hypothetical protein